jgi:hypothetical protein
MRPKFTHDCTNCVYLGKGSYCEKDVDWYVCKSSSERRTVVARYSDKGSDYASATIGDTVVPCRLVLAALAQGLDLTDKEKDLLLQKMLTRHRQGLSITDLNNLLSDTARIGNSDWLSTKLL